MKKSFIAVVAATMLGGCSSFVTTTSTTFQAPDSQQRGTVSVQPRTPEQQNSLEFSLISEKLMEKLKQAGYSQGTGRSTDFVAYISYEIDSGSSSNTSAPLYGQTGGGATYSSGTATVGRSSGSYSSVTISQPTYGIVGDIPVTKTTYRRTVNIDIFKQRDKSKVYEIRGTSTGSCGNLSELIYPILDGMFANFPGENGKSKSTNVIIELQCPGLNKPG